MVEKGLDGLAVFIFLAICAGDVTFSQAALLHPALGPAQTPRAVEVSRFAALTGFQILAASSAVGAAAADLLCAVHRGASISKW